MPTMGTSSANTAPSLNIQETVSCQNPHKASCLKQIISRFLKKEMASSIAPALTYIYQASCEQGQIPNDWKRAFVTLLFLKGDRSKAANYCPVSLTFYCCKVIEHIVHNYLMKCMEINKILSDTEHGFRERRSCEDKVNHNHTCPRSVYNCTVTPPPPPHTHIHTHT